MPGTSSGCACVSSVSARIRRSISGRRSCAALGRGGCNQGACHGSPQGKGGFRLSLRGFDPELDYATLTREAFGRRTDVFAPAEQALSCRKATIRVPHQGGRRFQEDDTAYRLLHDWIAQGCRPSPSARLADRRRGLALATIPSLVEPATAARGPGPLRRRFGPRRHRPRRFQLQQRGRRPGDPSGPGRIPSDGRDRHPGALPRADRDRPADVRPDRPELCGLAAPAVNEIDRHRLREAPPAPAPRRARRRRSCVPAPRLPRPDRQLAHAGGGHPVPRFDRPEQAIQAHRRLARTRRVRELLGD